MSSKLYRTEKFKSLAQHSTAVNSRASGRCAAEGGREHCRPANPTIRDPPHQMQRGSPRGVPPKPETTTLSHYLFLLIQWPGCTGTQENSEGSQETEKSHHSEGKTVATWAPRVEVSSQHFLDISSSMPFLSIPKIHGKQKAIAKTIYTVFPELTSSTDTEYLLSTRHRSWFQEYSNGEKNTKPPTFIAWSLYGGEKGR